MLYKRQRIIRKAVVIYEPPTVKGYASTVKGNLYNKKYVFKRITGIRIFNCSGCVLEGKCDWIYTVQSREVIKKYCREQSKFFDIHVFYKCYL